MSKTDQIFDEVVLDPVRRQERIAGIRKIRPWLLAIAVILALAVICGMIDFALRGRPLRAGLPMVLVFVLFVSTIFLRLEAEMKILRAIDLLQKTSASRSGGTLSEG
jgi:hypothetical protein